MKVNEIRLQRLFDDGDSTVGIFKSYDLDFKYFTVEDEYRDKKIKGETRIPAGIYKLKIRRELTGLTKKYRANYKWFKYHIELQDVPGFKYVYIHVGNTDDNTEGCILLNEGANIHGRGTTSRRAYEKFYKKTYPMLERDEIVILNIKDEKNYFEPSDSGSDGIV